MPRPIDSLQSEPVFRELASRLATGLSSDVWWVTERVVEKPWAPAAIASRDPSSSM